MSAVGSSSLAGDRQRKVSAKEVKEALSVDYDLAKRLVSERRFEDALQIFTNIDVALKGYRNTGPYIRMCLEALGRAVPDDGGEVRREQGSIMIEPSSIAQVTEANGATADYERAKELIAERKFDEALELLTQIDLGHKDFRNTNTYITMCEAAIEKNNEQPGDSSEDSDDSSEDEGDAKPEGEESSAVRKSSVAFPQESLPKNLKTSGKTLLIPGQVAGSNRRLSARLMGGVAAAANMIGVRRTSTSSSQKLSAAEPESQGSPRKPSGAMLSSAAAAMGLPTSSGSVESLSRREANLNLPPGNATVGSSASSTTSMSRRLSAAAGNAASAIVRSTGMASPRRDSSKPAATESNEIPPADAETIPVASDANQIEAASDADEIEEATLPPPAINVLAFDDAELVSGAARETSALHSYSGAQSIGTSCAAPLNVAARVVAIEAKMKPSLVKEPPLDSSGMETETDSAVESEVVDASTMAPPQLLNENEFKQEEPLTPERNDSIPVARNLEQPQDQRKRSGSSRLADVLRFAACCSPRDRVGNKHPNIGRKVEDGTIDSALACVHDVTSNAEVGANTALEGKVNDSRGPKISALVESSSRLIRKIELAAEKIESSVTEQTHPSRPTREIIHVCSEKWLESMERRSFPARSCVVTSLPAWSDMPAEHAASNLENYLSTFQRYAALTMTRCAERSLTVFLQTDFVYRGHWVDLSALLCETARQTGMTLIWHKIVFDKCEVDSCSIAPGSNQYRPMVAAKYSHVLAFTAEQMLGDDRFSHSTIPDLISSDSHLPMGDVFAWLGNLKPSVELIIDPFCSRGTMVSLANHYGFSALGVSCCESDVGEAAVCDVTKTARISEASSLPSRPQRSIAAPPCEKTAIKSSRSSPCTNLRGVAAVSRNGETKHSAYELDIGLSEKAEDPLTTIRCLFPALNLYHSSIVAKVTNAHEELDQLNAAHAMTKSLAAMAHAELYDASVQLEDARSALAKISEERKIVAARAEVLERERQEKLEDWARSKATEELAMQSLRQAELDSEAHRQGRLAAELEATELKEALQHHQTEQQAAVFVQKHSPKPDALPEMPGPHSARAPRNVGDRGSRLSSMVEGIPLLSPSRELVSPTRSTNGDYAASQPAPTKLEWPASTEEEDPIDEPAEQPVE